MTTVDLLSFSMRTKAPEAGADWFRIVEAKTATEPTKVYIYDEIGYWGTNAKDFAALIAAIETDEVHIHINSPGGSVFDGLAIHSTIKDLKAKTVGKVDGLAASAASFILQACDVRQTARNAQVMIHDAKAYAGGNAQQMRNAAELLDRVSDNIADIYAVRSGQTQSADEFRASMKAGDKWYSGNEALDAGLVDEVLDNPEEDEDTKNLMKNSWSTDEVEKFLNSSPEQLAAPGRVSVTNRVEEALMTGNDPQNKNTPPAVTQPPAPAVVAPVAAVVAPVAPVSVEATSTLVVNGAAVTDFAAVQAHITALEVFKTETIEGNRKSFVASLANGASPKILATEVANMEEFAISLSDEQFGKWKASMEAAPANSLLANHGVAPGDKNAPTNGPAAGEKAERIKVLNEILEAHKSSGLSAEEIATKASFKELQGLLAEPAK